MLYILIVAGLVIIDQWSKYLTVTYLKPIGSIPLIPNVFHLTYGQNTGAAFSILQGKQTFLIILTSIVIAVLILYLIRNYKKGSKLLNLSIAFIIGGALGNLIDRVRLNYVVDLFDFTLINYPVFNSADIFVVLGTLALAYSVLSSDKARVR